MWIFPALSPTQISLPHKTTAVPSKDSFFENFLSKLLASYNAMSS
jgi:hypothetical protein